MSYTIQIHEKEEIDFDDLYRYLQMRNSDTVGQLRNDDLVYFYRDGYSFRGVDFSKEDYGYEIRLTILSNAADYYTAVLLMEYFKMFRREAKIIDENETTIKDIYNLFTDEIIADNFKRDVNTVKLLVEYEGHTITFYGPNAEFYIGPNVLKNLNAQEEGFEHRLEKLIKKVLYQLPENENPTVMAMGNDEENQKIIKLVTESSNYILQKYDYLIFNKNLTSEAFEDMIFVTNDDLNAHLPEEWQLIDEYTIVAPALGSKKYLDLVEKLIPFDQKDQLK